MRVVIAVLVVALAAQAAYGDVLSEKWNEIKDEYSTRFSNMKDQLKDLGTAMKNVAVDKAKGLLSQTLQALIGAVANTIKGTSLGDAIGKRELFDYNAYLTWLVENTKEKIGDLFDKTFGKFNAVIDRIANGEQTDAEETKMELQQTAEAHNMAVRGVISDTLNKGIDMVKSVWQKLKDAVGKPIPVEPVMISKRESKASLLKQMQEIMKKIMDQDKLMISKRAVLWQNAVNDLEKKLKEKGLLKKKDPKDFVLSRRAVLNPLWDDWMKPKGGLTWEELQKEKYPWLHTVSKRSIADLMKDAYKKYMEKTWKERVDSKLLISRRSFFTDVAQSLKEKFSQIHDAVKPHWDKIHLITTDIGSALAHHAGIMMEASKQDALEKMKDMADTLSGHLENAKSRLGQMKEEVSAKIQGVLSG